MARPGIRLASVVLGAPDPRRLAGFYERLLGWSRRADEPDWVIIASADGRSQLSFQHEPEFERPVWPGRAGQQQMTMHLDIAVTDLDEGVQWAISAGAELAGWQPQAEVRVMLDPDGHPFCLFATPWAGKDG